jgi:enoyl-CoA hydratase/carnithine racemase
MAAEASALERCMGTEDWREGIAAAREKRAPRYSGR